MPIRIFHWLYNYNRSASFPLHGLPFRDCRHLRPKVRQCLASVHCSYDTSQANDHGWLFGRIISSFSCQYDHIFLNGTTLTLYYWATRSPTEDPAILYQVRWQSSDLSILETTPTLNWLVSSTESGVPRATSSGPSVPLREPGTAFPTGAIAGIAIGAVFLALFFMGIVAAMFRIRRRHSRVHTIRSGAQDGGLPEIGGSRISGVPEIGGSRIYEKDSTPTAEMDSEPTSNGAVQARALVGPPAATNAHQESPQLPPLAFFGPLELVSHAEEMSLQRLQDRHQNPRSINNNNPARSGVSANRSTWKGKGKLLE